ncbi:ParA family protein [Candidatus Enterovibrio escicola]|uniref:ParA family protein n=1 Tax=Candidatus Enterovibrio escicola TaxID=1927127 RepID=UPI00168199E0|nr:ParA family protein [Candidatus Enterovibrio escacola]
MMSLKQYFKIGENAKVYLEDREQFKIDQRVQAPDRTYSQAEFIRFLKHTNKPVSKTKVSEIMEEMTNEGYTFTRQLKTNGSKGPYILSRFDMLNISKRLGVHEFRDKAVKKAFFVMMGSLKGGVGKSLCGNMLAHYFCYSPNYILANVRVLLLDLDPQATFTQQNSPVAEIGDSELSSLSLIIDNQITTEKIIERGIKKTIHPNIDLIQCDIRDGFIASELNDIEITDGAFVGTLIAERIAKKLENHYDIIIADVGPHLDDVLKNCLWAADQIFVPIPPRFYPFDSTMRFLMRLPNVMRELVEHGRPENELPDLIPFLTQVPLRKVKEGYDRDIFMKADSVINKVFDGDTISHDLPFEEAYERCSEDGHTVFSITPSNYSGDSKAFNRALHSATAWANKITLRIEREVFKGE